MLTLHRIAATLSVLLLMSMHGLTAFAQEDDLKAAVPPLRLSYIEGDVSFWRQGAEDWVEARLNTPLAAGDELFIERDSDLELQMGSSAFVRADDDTHLTLVNQASDFIQFKITSGSVSFDLRSLPSGYTVEVDTPNAVFTIDSVGYYRVDTNGDVNFITRRGGRARMVLAGGQTMSIHPSEEIVVEGSSMAQAKTYIAPEPDKWDWWNFDRSDSLLDTASERYLPPGISGASELDHYGNWRVMEDYGPVWVPDNTPPDWVPYSTGRWVWDPYYQWTWVDDAPWGWAPFHYGRWVYLSGYWAWAPGPMVRHPVYAPAMVAFFDVEPHLSAGIGIGGAGVGWVALSWGEPLTPWWGRPGYIGRHTWDGWGGPRVVNNIVIRNDTHINPRNIHYHNSRVNHAVVATPREHFGRGHVRDRHVPITQPRDLRNFQGALPLRPDSSSLVADARRGMRPPESMLSRQVLATRRPHESTLPWRSDVSRKAERHVPEQRYVPIRKHPFNDLRRPEFGDQTGAERPRPPLPPRFEERRREAEPTIPGNTIRETPWAARVEPKASQPPLPEAATPPRNMRDEGQPRALQERRMEHPAPESRRGEAAPIEPRTAPEETQHRGQVEHERANLPGKPANRVYRDKNRDKNKEKNKSQHSQQRRDN